MVTTERGLPIALKLDKRELTKAPQDLAGDILRLCQVSAMRAQVARRQEMAARGVAASVVNSMPLATEAELTAAESELRGGDDDDDEDRDGPPASWLRPL